MAAETKPRLTYWNAVEASALVPQEARVAVHEVRELLVEARVKLAQARPRGGRQRHCARSRARP
eukprot:scaffold93181_cov54-Phaeocystis_antarctica.AAC.2